MLKAMLIQSPILRSALAGFCALVACVSAPPALAQSSYGGSVGYAETPSAALARNVRLLAVAPRSFEALIGAGRAALALGDTQAAVGFFGRAEEVSPRSFAPKAGTGAALVAMEEPVQALGYFAEAMRLGATQSSIGADRGLAYDLTGEPALAQADYRAALLGQDRDEARRRLALSLAMARDRAGALAAIAPLMSRRDPATERVRAFVLAMVGDVAGARRVVEAAMPAVAAHMEPFLHKLARMSPDQQVAAVHFGRFPDDSAIKLAAATPVLPPATTPTRVSPPRPAPPKRQASSQARKAEREDRFGRSSMDRETVTIRPAPATPPAKPPVAVPIARTEVPRASPVFTAASPPPVAEVVPDPAPAASAEMTAVQPQPQPPPVELAAATSTPAVDRLSDIEKLLGSPDEPIVRIPTTSSAPDELAPDDSAPPPSEPKVEAAAEKRAAGKKGKAKAEAAAGEDSPSTKKAKAAPKPPKSPGKYWVQLAGGAKTERMPVEYKRIRGKKPALFAKRTAYFAELKGWTRLLVGPFKSEDDSQEYVNQLAKADIDGFSWTSPTGQAIEKLPPK